MEIMTRIPYATIVEFLPNGGAGVVLCRCCREGDSWRLRVELMMDGNAPRSCEKGHTGKSFHTGHLVKTNILYQSKQKSEYKIRSHERKSGRKHLMQVAGKE